MDKPRTGHGASKGHPGKVRRFAGRPVGDAPSADKTPAGRKPIKQYPDLDKRRRIEDAEKAALGRVTVLAGDEVALGCSSSGWAAFADILRTRLRLLDQAKIQSADRIAVIWNKDGFKTGAGQRWTPRLVDVAKMKMSA